MPLGHACCSASTPAKHTTHTTDYITTTVALLDLWLPVADMQPISSNLLLLFTTVTSAYLTPNPPGKFNVTLTTGPLIDHSRHDPYAATPTPRALMLSVFQPATCAATVRTPYMPNKTAEFQGPYLEDIFDISVDFTPLFLEARLPVCASHLDTCSYLEDAPILLFSPGYSIPRLYYSILASAVASEGFTVITIDHPEDANIIVYPDGYAVYNNDTAQTDQEFEQHLPIRATDASFVIDQLSNATAMAKLLPHRGHRPFRTNQVAMFGHSEGGATAILAASQDPRIRAAVNWDGSIFLSKPLPKVHQPVLFMSHDNTTDPTWQAIWPQLEGPKLELFVANTTHETFSDIPTLIEADGQDLAPLADLLGSIDPAQIVRILTTYTSDWMKGAFQGRDGKALLEGDELRRYPEISVLLKGNL